MAYPSRVYAQEKIIPRQEPVVHGTGHRPSILQERDLNFFSENGYLVLPGILADQVEALLEDIPKLKADLKHRPELVIEPDSDEVRSIFSPDLYSEAYHRLAQHDYLKKGAEQILNSDVYIHHSRINVKTGLSGKSFPWHSDFETWHTEDGIPQMRIVTGWVFLSENDQFNGSLLAIPQSHKHFISCVGETPEDNFKTSLRKQEIGTPSKDILAKMVQQYGIVGLYGPPGTVVFHECNLLHGSADNISPLPRTNLFYVYNSVHNQPKNNLKTRPTFLARPYVNND